MGLGKLKSLADFGPWSSTIYKNLNLKLKITSKNFRVFLFASAVCFLAVLVGVFWWFPGVAARPQAAQLPIDDPFLLGQYYFNHGDRADGTYDLEKAREQYEMALTADPSANLLAWYQLGRIDFLEGDFDSAIYKFQKQIQYFDDELPNVFYMLGLTYAYKARLSKDDADWQSAAEYFSKYLEYDENSPWARVDLSWVYFSQGRYEEMLALLEPALTLHEDNPWFLNMYALSLLNTGRREEAHIFFQLAENLAAKLTPEEWGRTYPGNDPAAWVEGLEEFKRTLQENVKISSG